MQLKMIKKKETVVVNLVLASFMTDRSKLMTLHHSLDSGSWHHWLIVKEEVNFMHSTDVVATQPDRKCHRLTWLEHSIAREGNCGDLRCTDQVRIILHVVYKVGFDLSCAHLVCIWVSGHRDTQINVPTHTWMGRHKQVQHRMDSTALVAAGCSHGRQSTSSSQN